MTGDSLAIGAAAVASYTACSALDIELPSGRRVSPTAAFGPVLAALSAGGYADLPTAPLFLVAGAASSAATLLIRRNSREVLSHLLSLAASIGLMALASQGLVTRGFSKSIAVLVAVVVGSVVYYGFDVLLFSLADRRHSRAVAFEEFRAGWYLALVSASTAGLLALVYPRLGWVSFPLMLVPVLAARYELGRFGEAHRTYRQTVHALATLTEATGYVEMHHHARVASLCVAIGRELGLSTDRLRDLELVALLHDVGAVSIADPANVGAANPEEIAVYSGQVLEETEYLAKHASLLLAAAGHSQDIPLEARILRWANRFDELKGTGLDSVGSTTLGLMPADIEILQALSRLDRDGQVTVRP